MLSPSGPGLAGLWDTSAPSPVFQASKDDDDGTRKFCKGMDYLPDAAKCCNDCID